MWFIDIIRRQREERFLKDLMATEGAIDFVADRRVRQILREMRFANKRRVYLAWSVALGKWIIGKLTRKKVLREDMPEPVQTSDGLSIRPLGDDEK
jgi:hypothetical protein